MPERQDERRGVVKEFMRLVLTLNPTLAQGAPRKPIAISEL
jgi:hypothetical protein